MLDKVWKAKAKAQRRELESLRLSLSKQAEVLQRAKYLSVILRQARQQQDVNFGGDMAPLDMNFAEWDALMDFERMYQHLVNPATWFPVPEEFHKIATA